jgi:threonine/homoserine/homoserine lactone efflux protein
MLWSFFIAAVLIELTPGPNMTWLAVHGADHGRLSALAAVAGIAIGLALAAILTGLGLSALIQSFPVLFEALRWAGTLYLLYLAYDAWRDADQQQIQSAISKWKSFTQGIVTNLLNPKAYLFYAAILPQFVDASKSPVQQLVLLSAIYVSVATTIHTFIALAAGSAAAWLRTAPSARTLRKILAIGIACAAAWLFYSTKVTN